MKSQFPPYTPDGRPIPRVFTAAMTAMPTGDEKTMRDGNERLAQMRFETQGGLEEQPAPEEKRPFK